MLSIHFYLGDMAVNIPADEPNTCSKPFPMLKNNWTKLRYIHVLRQIHEYLFFYRYF